MKKFSSILFIFCVLLLLTSGSSTTNKRIKCLIQLDDYQGEGAYLIVSLVDNNGKYVKTLYVNGDDSEWYYEISSWWKHYGRSRYKIDGITGGTIASGGKKINVLSVEESYIDKGYSIRFETAVEEKNYFTQDAEIELKESNLSKKISGKGFIKYVRFLPA